jgi:endonuclease-3
MNKKSPTTKERIAKVNVLLVKYYGIPFRPKKLPNPIDALIATILSQNTNDNNSYKAYLNLKRTYESIDKLAEAPRREIENTIKVAGLGKQKSAAIKAFLSSLKKRRDKIDIRYIKKMDDEDILVELTSIKGVGVKTASCVLLFSLDRNVCPVDTHVHRALNRMGIIKAKTPDKTFEQIKNQLLDGIAHQFHTNLIKLGREICKPSKPLCTICPLLKVCSFKNKYLNKPSRVKNNSFLLLDSI